MRPPTIPRLPPPRFLSPRLPLPRLPLLPPSWAVVALATAAAVAGGEWDNALNLILLIVATHV